MVSSALPKAFVFDWDNTLVDSWPAIAEAMNIMREGMGLEPWTLEEVKTNGTRASRESFPKWFGDQWKKAYDLYYNAYETVRSTRQYAFIHGAEDLLKWLKQNGIPSFVVSNKRGDKLRSESTMLGWDDYFVAIIGAQDSPRDKPAREHVDHALARGGLIANPHIWFVGDSETDILCARNAGCTPVLIGSAQDAARLSVPLVFSDCQALQRLLNSRVGDAVG